MNADHETFTFRIYQQAAFAADCFGDKELAAVTCRIPEPGRVELYELNV
jgi:hypothetical protein